MKKIYVILNCLDKMGGLNVAVVGLCNELINEYDVEVISVFNGTDELPTKFKLDPRIKIKYAIPLAYRPFYKYNNKLLRKLDRALMLIGKGTFKIWFHKYMKKRSDSVVIFTMASFVPKRKTKYKKILNLHLNVQEIMKNKYTKSVLDNMQILDRIVVLSKDMVEYLNKKEENKSIFIPNILKLSNENNTNQNNKNIVYAGRINDEQKQVDQLIKAFSLIANKYKDWSLHIFGDGEDKEKNENLVKKLKLENRIIFRGMTDNLNYELRKMDIMAMTSSYEGLPNVLVEAASVGLALISYNSSSGIAEIIKDGINGFIIKKNDINLFAEKLLELIENEELRKFMGNNSIEIVNNNFSAEVIADRWKDVVREVYEGN